MHGVLVRVGSAAHNVGSCLTDSINNAWLSTGKGPATAHIEILRLCVRHFTPRERQHVRDVFDFSAHVQCDVDDWVNMDYIST